MASILKVQFPAGSPFPAKLMKFKAEKTISDAIAEITKQFNLGDPSDFLLYLPEGTEGAVTGWADNKAALASFDLKHKAVVHLKRKYQVARVVHKDLVKNVLFDWSGVTVGEWMPIVAKKFDKSEKCDSMHLYISGSKEPLKQNLSLVAQAIQPGVAFDFRSEDDPVGQAMLSSKERIAIGLNQAPLAEGAKAEPRGDRPPATPGKPRNEVQDETKTINIVNLNASVKGLKNTEIKGFLVKQTKKKSEKRYCALSEGHLFYYKTAADSKPSGVLDLQEYQIKALTDDPKKKAFPWEMVGRSADSRIVFIAASEKEKGDWVGLLTKAREGKLKSAAGGRRPGPPPPPAETTKPDLSAMFVKKGSNPKGGGKVFARPLPESVCNPDGSELPNIVLKCVSYIEKNAMDVEGIFRLSGSATLIEKYVARLDRGEDVDLTQEKDPHAVAGLMKLWFRDMPEPLLTFGAYQNFLGACSTRDRAVQLRYLRHLVNRLPVLNRTLLAYLLAFLRRVAEHAEVNMMALHNLATVFAPNLLRKAESSTLGMVVDTPLINSCFNVLLRDFEYVFGNKPIDATLTDEGTAATCCRALYDYKGESEDELSFQVGNIVKLIYERPDGWWIGEFKVGNFGRFPATYVKKWSAKQSESFTKRQQFKIRESNIKKALEHEMNQIKHLTEERDKVMQEIDDMNLRKAALEREFFILKKTLEPLLKNPIVFEKPAAAPQDDADDEGPEAVEKKSDKKEKKDKKDKKDKKKDGKKTTGKKPAEAKKNEERNVEKKPEKLPSNLEGKTLEIFPKSVDEFFKDSEDHKKALQTVDQTKDNLLASLEMLLGALPLKDKKEGKKYEPVKFMIENIKTKTKGEAFSRAQLADRKEDIIKDLTELRALMKYTVSRRDEQFELGEGVDPASVLKGIGSGTIALPRSNSTVGAGSRAPKMAHQNPNMLSELASVLVSTDRQAKALIGSDTNLRLRGATTSSVPPPGPSPTPPSPRGPPPPSVSPRAPPGAPPPGAPPSGAPPSGAPPTGGGRGGFNGSMSVGGAPGGGSAAGGRGGFNGSSSMGGGGRAAMMASAGMRGGMMAGGGGGRGAPQAAPTWERGRRMSVPVDTRNETNEAPPEKPSSEDKGSEDSGEEN